MAWGLRLRSARAQVWGSVCMGICKLEGLPFSTGGFEAWDQRWYGYCCARAEKAGVEVTKPLRALGDPHPQPATLKSSRAKCTPGTLGTQHRTLHPWLRSVSVITSVTLFRLGTSNVHYWLNLKMSFPAQARRTSFSSHVSRKRSNSSEINSMKSVRDTNQTPWVLVEAAEVSKLLFKNLINIYSVFHFTQ